MLSSNLFIEKFDNEELKSEDIKNIPFDFIRNDNKSGYHTWLPLEQGYGYLIFVIDNRFFIKIKSDNMIFELKNYK